MNSLLKIKLYRSDVGVKFDESLTLGGEDADWLKRIDAKFGPHGFIDRALYFIRFHPNRIGVWKRSPGNNPSWHGRMREASVKANIKSAEGGAW